MVRGRSLAPDAHKDKVFPTRAPDEVTAAPGWRDVPETPDFISPPPCRSATAAPGFNPLTDRQIQLRSEHVRAGYRS